MPTLCSDLVSVIMPAYNSEASVADSIRSVISQTYGQWELIVIDDASTDRTTDIVEKFSRADRRIQMIRLDQNGGVANARNLGMHLAKGRYLAFLDSDDLWLTNKLETQIRFMVENRAAFSFAQYRHFYANGRVGAVVDIPAKVEYSELLKGNVIGCLTVMIDRKFVPSFSMPEHGHEDYVCWLRVLRDGFTAWGIKEDLARYRVSSDSVSANKKRSVVWTWKIYRDIEGLSIARATWFFAHYSIKAALKHWVR